MYRISPNGSYIRGSQKEISSVEFTDLVGVFDRKNAHESLTFRDEIAYEIAKGLMDEAKENIPCMEIFKNHSGNTLRVSEIRFSNEMSVKILLGYTLSCRWRVVCHVIVMKKIRVRGHVYMQLEYHVVYTGPDITYADMGMLDEVDLGLQMGVQVFVDSD
ncbi:hypothetical protein Tco_0792105 [Tanacetum coccineum]